MSVKRRTQEHVPVAYAVPVPSAPPEEDDVQAGTVFRSALAGGPKLTPRAQELGEAMGFTDALLETLVAEARRFAYRIVIVDNSGSMTAPDGSYCDGRRMRPCSRWRELTQAMQFHAAFADAAGVPCSFRLLNAPTFGRQAYAVGSENASPEDVDAFLRVLKNAPNGGTPLVAHIERAARFIRTHLPALSQLHQRVMLVIWTDGLPSDGGGHSRSFIDAVRKLEGLPVKLVVRLCTDERRVVSFWNEVDQYLEEVPVDVLDDLESEANEIAAHQSWLTYAPALHLLREFGTDHSAFDLLDERSLFLDEAAELLEKILGPLPEAYSEDFFSGVQNRLRKAPRAFHPVRGRMLPWVDEARLRGAYAELQSVSFFWRCVQIFAVLVLVCLLGSFSVLVKAK